MLSKEELEFAVAELKKEPANIYSALDKLVETTLKNDKIKILEAITALDEYAYSFLNTEEIYAKLTNYPKLELLKSDHNYYRATFYRLRYHYIYFDIESRTFKQILQYSLHLISNLKEWLDFHKNTLDNDLIEYLTTYIKKLDEK